MHLASRIPQKLDLSFTFLDTCIREFTYCPLEDKSYANHDLQINITIILISITTSTYK